MLHHATLEISSEDLPGAIRFWSIVGFSETPAPDSLRGQSVWLERHETQIHLLLVPEPVAPPQGHAAVVVDDLGAVSADLEAAGFEVVPKRRLWDGARAGVVAPGGHRVELMASPPGSAQLG